VIPSAQPLLKSQIDVVGKYIFGNFSTILVSENAFTQYFTSASNVISKCTLVSVQPNKHIISWLVPGVLLVRLIASCL